MTIGRAITQRVRLTQAKRPLTSPEAVARTFVFEQGKVSLTILGCLELASRKDW